MNSLIEKTQGSTAVIVSLAVAAVACAAGGVLQVIHDPQSQTDLISTADYVMISLFTVALITMAPGFLALASKARDHKGAIAAAAGTFLLGVTCITSIVNGDDLALFNVVAPLTNAMWLFGSIALAVSLKRTGNVPATIWAVPVVWVAMIPLSQFGFGLVAAAYWMNVAFVLNSEREQAGAAVPATA